MTYRAQANRRARSRRGGFRSISKHHPGEIRMPWFGRFRVLPPGVTGVVTYVGTFGGQPIVVSKLPDTADLFVDKYIPWSKAKA